MVCIYIFQYEDDESEDGEPIFSGAQEFCKKEYHLEQMLATDLDDQRLTHSFHQGLVTAYTECHVNIPGIDSNMVVRSPWNCLISMFLDDNYCLRKRNDAMDKYSNVISCNKISRF